jgi:predicted AAA+ superfamily ATPase
MNNALLSAQSSTSFESIQINKALWGRWVESAIGCHLIAHLSNDIDIFYWNESNAEVDFIIKKDSSY